jgi:hypothetical protein
MYLPRYRYIHTYIHMYILTNIHTYITHTIGQDGMIKTFELFLAHWIWKTVKRHRSNMYIHICMNSWHWPNVIWNVLVVCAIDNQTYVCSFLNDKKFLELKLVICLINFLSFWESVKSTRQHEMTAHCAFLHSCKKYAVDSSPNDWKPLWQTGRIEIAEKIYAFVEKELRKNFYGGSICFYKKRISYICRWRYPRQLGFNGRGTK